MLKVCIVWINTKVNYIGFGYLYDENINYTDFFRVSYKTKEYNRG